MKKIFKRITAAIGAVSILMSSAGAFDITAVAEAPEAMKASFERVQFDFAYADGTAWDANAFAKSKNGTPKVDKIGNLFGVHGSNTSEDVTLTYKPDKDITGYEVVFSATTNSNLRNSNLSESQSVIYYSADNSTYTRLTGGDNYQRTDTVDFYNGTMGDGTKPLQANDVYKHVMTNKVRLPEGTQYFRVYSKGKNWKSTFNSIKLWGAYEGTDEVSQALAGEMAFSNISNGQAADNVQTALNLPEAAAGQELVWYSSNDAVINSVTGAVTVPDYTETVTLTATAAYTPVDGEETRAQFDYELTVRGSKENQATANLYTYGSAEGLKSDGEVFDGIHMVDWTKSRISGEGDKAMFEPYAFEMPDGTTAYTLKRRRTNNNNNNSYEGYVTYRADYMTGFDVSIILGKTEDVLPVMPTFELSADGVNFTAFKNIVADRDMPAENGEYVNITYTGYNLPEDARYLRINLPRPPKNTDAGFKCVQLEKVKFNCMASLGEWAAPDFDVQFDGAVAQLSWNELESDGDFSYEVYKDGVLAATLPKGSTGYTFGGLEEHTEYQFAVGAVAKSGDNTPKLSSEYQVSDVLKSSGNENTFINTFKFEQTLAKYASWSNTPKFNADNLTAERTTTTDLSATYDVGGLISDFTVDFMIYKAKVDVTGNSTFEVSADGENWTAVTASKTGDAPGNYSTVPWSYSANNIQQTLPGAKYLRINFGAVADNRTNTFQLKKVNVTKLSGADAEEIETVLKISAAMSWDKLFTAAQNSVGVDLALPQLVCSEGYTVSWSSDNEGVITSEGKITRGDAEQTARLTAEVTYAEGKTVKFTYDIVVIREGIDAVVYDDCGDFSKTYEHSDKVAVRDLTNDCGEPTAFGISDKTLQDPENQYVVYKLDGISGFDIKVLENTQGQVGKMKFEAAGDDGVFTALDGVIKTDSQTLNNGGWSSAHYIANSLPEDTRYLKMYFVTYVLAPTNKCWSFNIDSVKLMQTKVEYAYEWQTDAAISVTDVTANSARVSWTDIAGKTDDIVYKLYVNGNNVDTLSGTTAVIDNLTRNTVNRVYVRAVNADDAAKISKKLSADDFRTARKQGEAQPAVDPEGAELALSNAAGDIFSASADITLTGSKATFGFKNVDGSIGNAYVEITPNKVTYYKNGKVVAEEKHYGTASANVTTDDCWLPEEGAKLFIEGADWNGVVLYKSNNTEYFRADRIDATQVQHIDLDMPLEALPSVMTFETNITVPADCESDIALVLYSGNGKKLAELTQSKVFEHGKNGALYLTYPNTPLYEARTWLPRLEYDGVSRNLKLFINPIEKTVTVAIDNKVVADGLTVSDIEAADLAYIELKGGYILNDTVISSGYRGFAYKPLAITSDGKPVSALNAGDKAKLTLEIVNSVSDMTVSLFARQDKDGYVEKIDAAIDAAVPAKEGWQTVSADVTALSDNPAIKAYAWDNSMRPIGEVGGYYETDISQNADKRLFLIGDSTVRYVYKTGQNPPNIGWGEVIGQFLNENVTVYNYAKDGTSSKTYAQSGRLNAMKEYMRPGDYLMFQLGHNDRNPQSRPDKGTTKEEYKGYLRGYVAQARQLGLNMIFVTPVALQADVTEDGAAKDPAKSSLYTYVTAMEEVAAELDVPIIDLFRTSITKLHAAGVTSSDEKDIYTDGTHFTEAGAKLLCGYIKSLLNECEGTDFGKYFE